MSVWVRMSFSACDENVKGGSGFCGVFMGNNKSILVLFYFNFLQYSRCAVACSRQERAINTFYQVAYSILAGTVVTVVWRNRCS